MKMSIQIVCASAAVVIAAGNMSLGAFIAMAGLFLIAWRIA